MTDLPTGPMRFHVDSWDPSYGSSVEAEEQPGSSDAKVTLDVETAVEDWASVAVTSVVEPGALIFVDGVRRTDARVWIDQLSPDGTVEGTIMALCASYAAGTVCCCSNGSHLLDPLPRRGLFTTATNAQDVDTDGGTYRATRTADSPEENLAALLSQALQRNLADLEVVAAVNARAGLADHGVADGTDLLVVDGPLRGRTHLPRALGFIKSHRTRYLPEQLNQLVGSLYAGERSPVFLMGTSWDRYAWYLRLPSQPGPPWAGVARLECAADMTAAEAISMANLSQAVLPRFASVEYKDPRAPQNLVPVAGLERELRRRLGDARLLTRQLRMAASRAVA